ncbi:MAG: hypothetical protein LBB94_08780 [Clostridiales bacterium]|nr:hypothetical protein [Clostridiales bacterium]
MSFKPNLSQKLLIAIAAALFIAGAGKLLYYRLMPFDVLLFCINNLERSSGFEQEMRIIRQSGVGRQSGASIPEALNDTQITVNYKKKADTSQAVFTLSTLGADKAPLNGELYTGPDLTALSLSGRTIYTRRGGRPAVGLKDSLQEIKNSVKNYFQYQSGSAITIYDFGKPADLVMDSFSLVMEDGESENLAECLTALLDKSMPGVSEYLKQTLNDSVPNIYAVFQIDDFMRLRGIHAEIRFDEIGVLYDMNTIRIGKNISTTPPDIANGVDAGNSFRLKELLDLLAGGK